MTAALLKRRLRGQKSISASQVTPASDRMECSTSCLDRTYLSSDPNFLLEYMAGIASDDSNDDFDGYLLSDDELETGGKNYLHCKLLETFIKLNANKLLY